MLMSASSSSSPRHRGSIERGVDGGNHRVIGGRAGEMCGDRLQERIALSNRQDAAARCRASIASVTAGTTPACSYMPST
jgi:hypothetical protein